MQLSVISSVVAALNSLPNNDVTAQGNEQFKNKAGGDSRSFGRLIALNPLDIRHSPEELVMSTLKSLEEKMAKLPNQTTEKADEIRDIASFLFESLVQGINNRVKILYKMPEMNEKLKNLASEEKDEDMKMIIELAAELLAVKRIKWARNGFKSFNSYANHSELHAHSWNQYIEELKVRFDNLFTKDYLDKFKLESIVPANRYSQLNSSAPEKNSIRAFKLANSQVA